MAERWFELPDRRSLSPFPRAVVTFDRTIRDTVRRNHGPVADVLSAVTRPISSRKLLLVLTPLLWTTARYRGSAPLERFAVDATWGIIAAALATAAIKALIHRQRPDAGVQGGSPIPGRSFPSGHAGNIFAIALVLSRIYHRPWITALAFAVAAAGTLGRINDDRHWASDVIVGAAVGYAAAALLTRTPHNATSVRPRRREPPSGAFRMQ